jgi:hypothetical protein
VGTRTTRNNVSLRFINARFVHSDYVSGHIDCRCHCAKMLAAVLVLLVWSGLKASLVSAWLNAPGNACTQCCCCVVTTAGTRNFCPAVPGWTSAGGYDSSNDTALVPNCYYLQSHSSAIRSNFDDGLYGGIVDTYSQPGSKIYWRPTDPAYGCFKDLETVTATLVATSALPTVRGDATAVAGSAPTSHSNVGSGGCIFNGGNLTGIICGNNTNSPIVSNPAGIIRVNYSLLICCIVLAIVVVVVRGDTAGGCIINGGNQSGVSCNNNVVTNVATRAGFIAQLPVLQWTAIVSVLLCVGLVMGDDTAGGCVINNGTQNGFTCDNNTVHALATSNNHGLSPAEIAGIVGGSLAGVIALLTLGASFMNPKAEVAGKSVWEYRRAVVYRIVEGCTFGFGCGCLSRLKRKVETYVEIGGIWKKMNGDRT